MADLHPIESGDLFQEASPEGRPAESRPAESRSTESRPTESRPTERRSSQSRAEVPPGCSRLLRSRNIQRHTRHLRRAVRYLEELRKTLYDHERCVSPQRTTPPSIPALPPEGGEYRLFYVSPSGLQLEQEFLQNHNARGLKDLLHLSSSILHSYSGLIHNFGDGPSELDSVLASMADVLQLALNAVNSAEQLCGVLEPVDLQTRQSPR